MKILLLNGSPNVNGCTHRGLTEIANTLKECDIDSEIFHIGTKPISGCIACYTCRKTGSGHCVLKDDIVNPLIEKICAADGLIVGSPVYYAGMNGTLKAILDRTFFAKPATIGKPAAAIVTCRRGGALSTFDQINHYFSIAGMPIITSNYWNQIHGSTPADVEQDLEGLQTLRILARNMATFLYTKAGDPPHPATQIVEERTWTHFIRN